ncbi:hypothetical protein [Streptomyces sp. NPDC020607]|uniref:hypothetical protein n=1 Tax=Streptomyces sp. NPDC020607 TaxID=3365082 RepID=UPI0037AA441E
MALTSSLSIAASAELSTALDLTTGRAPLQVRRSVSLASGTGVGQADKVFSDRRTLAASASEDLDLAGVLLDAFGATITFARVKGIIVSAAAGNTNSVVIGAASSNPWATLLNATGTLTLRPGDAFSAHAGQANATAWAVAAGTGDLLKVANSGAGTPVTYDVVIIGASA